jgi:hypothetical protein
MNRFLSAIANDLREVVRPVLFLFFMFELVSFSNALLLESYSVTPTHTLYAAVGALIGGKAILVANKTPFLHLFQRHAVIITVLWRSFIYAVFCALFLCSEHVVTGLFEKENPVVSLETLAHGVSLDHVAANVIWLFVSLMLYNSYVEVDRCLGPGTLRKIFLQRAKASQAGN